MTTRLLLSLTVLWVSSLVHGWVPSVSTRAASSSSSLPSSLMRLQASTSTTAMDTAIVRGDAKGAALLVDNVSISRGSNVILQDISWRVEPCAKWGLVGPNGAGKSTLLKALMGELSYDGAIIVGSTQQMGYLQQTSVSGSTKTVFDEAASAMMEIETAKQELDTVTTWLEQHGNDDTDKIQDMLDQLDRAVQRFEAVGGYTQEQTVTQVLRGLGFTNLEQTCDSLSGGWQMRVSLAKLLLSQPTLLVLDEPSNHLDVHARKWLAQYLRNYQQGAMVLVTHDLFLLSSVQHIAEVAHGSLSTYKSCTYTEYLEEKEFRATSALAEFERNAQQAAKLQSFVDRFGASAARGSAAQSRVKQLNRMEQQGLLDAPTGALQQPNHFLPTLRLPPPSKAIGHVLLELKQAQVGWTPDRPLVSNVNLQIAKGMKLWIKGPNGAGKSTLLAGLRGTLALIQGTRHVNEMIRMGVFTQDLAQELDVTARAVDLVTAHARAGDGGDINISDQKARNVMGQLGLSADKPLRRVGDLSGGEKARVALAMFCLKASNILLLDEPSNHLDVECVKALSSALSDWGKEDGAVVVVSHDQAFCQSVGFTHVATVANGCLTLEERNIREDDFVGLDLMESSVTHDTVTATAKPTAAAAADVSMDSARRKQAYNAPKRIAKLETMIQQAEQKVAALEQEMMAHGHDVKKLMEMTKRKEAELKKITSYETEWTELEELLAAVAA